MNLTYEDSSYKLVFQRVRVEMLWCLKEHLVKVEAGDLDCHPCSAGCVASGKIFDFPQHQCPGMGVGLAFLECWIFKSPSAKIPPLCFVFSEMRSRRKWGIPMFTEGCTPVKL